ncbi:MAG: transposase, partial [Anaerolineales bacterium]
MTICTAQRRHLFGEVADDSVNLSPLGEIADALLLETPIHFGGTDVICHVVMPNHLHAILVFPDRARRGVQLNAP